MPTLTFLIMVSVCLSVCSVKQKAFICNTLTGKASWEKICWDFVKKYIASAVLRNNIQNSVSTIFNQWLLHAKFFAAISYYDKWSLNSYIRTQSSRLKIKKMHHILKKKNIFLNSNPENNVWKNAICWSQGNLMARINHLFFTHMMFLYCFMMSVWVRNVQWTWIHKCDCKEVQSIQVKRKFITYC